MEYQNSNYSDYMTLNCYNRSNLGIPYFGTVKSGVQIVPNFYGFNYNAPNYNSLTFSDGNKYPTINTGYPKDENCVMYLSRNCNIPEDCGQGPQPGPPPTPQGLSCTDTNVKNYITDRITRRPDQNYSVENCMNDCNTNILMNSDGYPIDCTRDDTGVCNSVCTDFGGYQPVDPLQQFRRR